MLTVGTDFSGIEAPIQALEQLDINFRHLWSCEIDKWARMSIEANYHPDVIYKDITKRDHTQLPKVDIYVAGFPCQSFSSMGQRKGLEDPRGLLMNHTLDTIKINKPLIFILENVKGFKTIDGGHIYNYLLTELETIRDNDNTQLYEIFPHVYNTKDYGIPQNRERLYIIGITNWILVDTFKIPPKIPMKPLEDFIIDKKVYELNTKSQIILKKIKSMNYKNGYIISDSNFLTIGYNYSPTLTANKCNRFYHTTYNRFLTIEECLSLQGFSKDFKIIASKTRMYKQIGNSMSVNVLKVIFKEIFRCTLFCTYI